jgi:hypothetical protein
LKKNKLKFIRRGDNINKDKIKDIDRKISLLLQEKRRLKAFSKIEELKYDDEFFKNTGRYRNVNEIARILHYSERQIYRIIKKEGVKTK